MDFEAIDKFYCDTDSGLEIIVTYLLILMVRYSWDVDWYSKRGHERYIVNTLHYVEFDDDIIKALIEKFDLDGDKYPVSGALTMDELDNYGTTTYHISC